MGYVFLFAAGVAVGIALDVFYSKRVVEYVQGLEHSIKNYIDARLK